MDDALKDPDFSSVFAKAVREYAILKKQQQDEGEKEELSKMHANPFYRGLTTNAEKRLTHASRKPMSYYLEVIKSFSEPLKKKLDTNFFLTLSKIKGENLTHCDPCKQYNTNSCIRNHSHFPDGRPRLHCCSICYEVLGIALAHPAYICNLIKYLENEFPNNDTPMVTTPPQADGPNLLAPHSSAPLSSQVDGGHGVVGTPGPSTANQQILNILTQPGIGALSIAPKDGGTGAPKPAKQPLPFLASQAPILSPGSIRGQGAKKSDTTTRATKAKEKWSTNPK